MSRRRGTTAAFSLFSFQDIITSVTGIMILVTLILALDLMNRTVQSPESQTIALIEESAQTIEQMQQEIEELRKRLDSGVASMANLPSLDASMLERMLRDTTATQQKLNQDTVAKQSELDRKESQLQSVSAAAKKDEAQEAQTLEDLQNKIDDMTVKLESIESNDRVFFKEGVSGKDVWIVEITRSEVRVGMIGISAPPKLLSSDAAFSAWLTSISKSKAALYFVVKPGGKDQFRRLQAQVTKAGFDVGYTVEPETRQVLDPKTGAGSP